MTFPNLYIVGAPKSGTTSLYHYLNQHPDINIPNKEPRFLINNIINSVSEDDPIKPYLIRSSILDKNEYNSLYSGLKEKIICDASTQYLYHYSHVIPKIKQLKGPSPKIIILLRNPIDRAFSNYSHISSTFENLSFDKAIKQETIRRQKGFNSFWFYIGLSTYADSVRAYKDSFDNVKVVLFEDFINNTNLTLIDILDFLEVDNSFKFSNFMINKKSTGIPKSKTLNKILQNSSKFTRLKSILYKTFGQQKIQLFRELLMRKNLSKNKIYLDDSIKLKLESVFIDDIKELQKLLPELNIEWFKNGINS